MSLFLSSIYIPSTKGWKKGIFCFVFPKVQEDERENDSIAGQNELPSSSPLSLTLSTLKKKIDKPVIIKT